MRRAPGADVALLTGAPLCGNPRVVKEAKALAAAGLQVEVLGAWFDASRKAEDQAILRGLPFVFVPVADLTDPRARAQLQRVAARVRVKAGQLASLVAGIENRWQVGQTLAALQSAANRSTATLFIAHSEVGLAVASELHGLGRRIGVDMEDWFSKDLLPSARKGRPTGLLRDLEATALRKAAHTSCTSLAMSEALAQEYGCRPPTVVYNAFPWSDRESLDGLTKDRIDRSTPSIHWYSQTLGPGRGLEDLVAALPLIAHDVRIHLRGSPAKGFQDWIESAILPTWRNRIRVHAPVPNSELLSRISEHDIGFAGEMPYCRSRDLTVTNKALHYLLGGLAVVASDTTGQLEVAAQAPAAVSIYRSGDAVSLATQINRLLASRDILRDAQAAALRSARETFCWENVSRSLVTSVQRGLHQTALANV